MLTCQLVLKCHIKTPLFSRELNMDAGLCLPHTKESKSKGFFWPKSLSYFKEEKIITVILLLSMSSTTGLEVWVHPSVVNVVIKKWFNTVSQVIRN